jgi:hypothetical protein
VTNSARRVKAALMISLLALGLGIGALAYGLAANANRVDDVQRSRFEATLRACRSRSADAASIARMVQPRPPFDVADLRRVFRPVAGDCVAYARRTVAVP